MRVYFDNCCYGRPFDDQSQDKIRDETAAIQNIVVIAQCYGHTIFESAVLDVEIGKVKNKDAGKYADVLSFYKQVATERAVLKSSIKNYYMPLAVSAGVRGPDVFHLCFAISADVDYLVTTDKKFINATATMALPLTVINPLNFPLGVGGVV